MSFGIKQIAVLLLSILPGVIGGSWAAQYISRGFDVIATNPDATRNPNYTRILMPHGRYSPTWASRLVQHSTG